MVALLRGVPMAELPQEVKDKGLRAAAESGKVEVVRALLDAGADRTLRATGGDYVFKTALEIAEEECEAEVAALLRE